MISGRLLQRKPSDSIHSRWTFNLVLPFGILHWTLSLWLLVFSSSFNVIWVISWVSNRVNLLGGTKLFLLTDYSRISSTCNFYMYSFLIYKFSLFLSIVCQCFCKFCISAYGYVSRYYKNSWPLVHIFSSTCSVEYWNLKFQH